MTIDEDIFHNNASFLWSKSLHFMVTIFSLKNAISLSQLLYQLFHNFQYIGATILVKRNYFYFKSILCITAKFYSYHHLLK